MKYRRNLQLDRMLPKEQPVDSLILLQPVIRTAKTTIGPCAKKCRSYDDLEKLDADHQSSQVGCCQVEKSQP
jgi:hypothetical protein